MPVGLLRYQLGKHDTLAVWENYMISADCGLPRASSKILDRRAIVLTSLSPIMLDATLPIAIYQV